MKHILTVPGYLTALCILTILIYLPGLNGPFLLDDYSNFLSIQLNELSFDTLLNASVGNDTTNPYRPLSRATLILNNYFSGTAFSFYHKLTNLFIHLLTGITLYIFCRLCFTAVSSSSASPAMQALQNSNSQYSSALCLLIVAIWLVHPLQLSTVLYVVQRMAQLASLFTLLALTVYVHYRLAEKKGGQQKVVLPTISILFFLVLGVLCKENAALIPLYILAIESLLFRYQTNTIQNRRRLWVLQFILILLPVIIGFIYFLDHHEKLLNYASRDFTLADRLLTQPVVVVFYLGQILLPKLSSMGLFLDDFHVYRSFNSVVIFSILLLTGLTFLAILTRKRTPLIAFGITWFLVSHLLESSFLPLEMVFEHRNYLALFGPVLSLVLGTLYACENLKCSGKSISVLAFIVILILAGQTMLRTLSWSSIESFAANHLINHPGSVRTHILLADIAFKNGNREVALSELEQVSRINPADISHHVLRVLAWCKDGVTKQQMDDAVNATASISYRKSARSVLYAIRKIENNYATGICPAVSSKDLLRLTSALISNDVIRNLSLKYHLHARALVSNNMLDDARSYYLKAWRAGPLNTHPVFELVELLNERQLYKDACEIVAEFDKYQVKYNNNDATEIARLKNACRE